MKRTVVGTFLGYRKFVVMLLLIAVAVAFRVQNLIDGAQFVDLLKEAALVFIGGNTAEHATNTVKHWIDSKVSATVDDPDVKVVPGV